MEKQYSNWDLRINPLELVYDGGQWFLLFLGVPHLTFS
jgi:hypothetical protein